MEDRRVIPFDRFIDMIVDKRVDQITFPNQLKALSIHFDSVCADFLTTTSDIQDKTDQVYYLLLEMIEHPHAEISKQIFLYLLRATRFLKSHDKLVEYLQSNIIRLLGGDYCKYVSLMVGLLKFLMERNREKALQIISDNCCVIFNLSLAIEDQIIGSPIKNFITYLSKNSQEFKQLFFSHVKKMSENIDSEDGCFKFVEFVDELISQLEREELESCESITNLYTVVYGCVRRIFFESNDELLRCALCNFFASKIGIDIEYMENFFPGLPVIDDMIRLVQHSTFEKPFDKELLRLLCYMCKRKGVTFMRLHHIDDLFIHAYNNSEITPEDMECVSRGYFELLSNYEIFMLLTSNTTTATIQSMNESMMQHIYNIVETQTTGVSYEPVLNRVIAFFSNHVHISGVELRTDYHDFVIRKHNFFTRFIEKQTHYIIKSTFETLDEKIQEIGLEFVISLLHYSWGFAAMIDCSDLEKYLLENRIGLSVDCHKWKRQIYQMVAVNDLFLSVLDPASRKQMIAIHRGQVLPKSIPLVASVSK